MIQLALQEEKAAHQAALQSSRSQGESISKLRLEAEISARNTEELQRNLADLGLLFVGLSPRSPLNVQTRKTRAWWRRSQL